MSTAASGGDVGAGDVRDTRAVILGAARRTFLRGGFHRATVDEIARSAGLAHGTFYRYFRNKQAVLDGLLADTIASFTLPAQAPDGEDVFTAVRVDLAAYMSHFWDHRDLGVIWTEAARDDERVALARDRLRRPFLDRLEQSVRRGIDSGAVAPIDVALAARALVTMGEHYTLDWLGDDAVGFDVDSTAHTVALIWCRGLGFAVTD